MEAAAWFVIWTFAAPALLANGSSINENNNENNDKTTRTRSDESKALSSSSASSASSIKIMPTTTTTTTTTHRVFGVDREIDIPPDRFPTEQELEQLNGASVLPACQKHGWYESVYHKAQLHYRYFLPSPIRAVVVYAHGIATHGGKALVLASSGRGRRLNASLVAASCLADGVALYMPDMYGHGYSEGVRFWIPDNYENNVEDLKRFVSEIVVKEHRHSNVPIFLMGESYGGCLSILLAKEYQDRPESAPPNFAGLLLAGPAIVADLPPYPVFFVLKNVLAPLFPRWIPFFMPNPLPPDRIWSDPEVVAARSDPSSPHTKIDGSGRAFRLGTAANLVRALQDCELKAIPALSAPFCVVHGVQDLGVPVRGSDYLWETARTPSDAKAYLRKDEGKHDMLADPHAEEAMEFMMEFLRKRIGEGNES
jgi:alpha-beta hydrolase superfamily lysophospholipase